jgi:hypothetical protein
LANTSYLRYEVEPWVREQLKEQFGQDFSPQELVLAPGGSHEFDAVSADRQIVGSIKANSGLTSGGNHPTGKVATVLNEVYYLSLVEAERRLLILTNPEFHSIFTETMAGKIAAGVEVMLIKLPVQMQETVDAVTRRASKEMAGPVAAAALAAEAEEAGERGQDVG